MLDIILRGGTIVDGSGRPGYRADVGIEGDAIATIGDLTDMPAAIELDATGCVVAPGFIDIHSHSDFTLLVDPRAHSAITQGVTTEIVGNCGHGCAPIGDPGNVTGNIYGYGPQIELEWRSTGQYLERVEMARPAVNVATLVPNGNLRLATVGLAERPAQPQERRAMARLLEQGLEEGAFGFSTGLEYPAERASTAAEIIELAGICARHGALYATHTRDRDAQALPAIEEAITTAKQAGCALQVSHIIPRRSGENTPWREAMELVDRAVEDGLDIAFDSHTRLHGTTNLSTVLPPDLAALEGSALVRQLYDPEVRARIRRYPSIVASWGASGWEHVFLFSARRCQDAVGMTIDRLAPAGGDGLDAVLGILIEEADDPHFPLACCHSYEEAWLRGTMRHPRCGVGSDATTLCLDGPLAGASFLGAYTWAGWFIRTLVREHGDLRLEQAIHKLTAMPAERVGLPRRGRLQPGYFADVSAFDPARFGERGTLAQPNLPAEGMRHVLVNGVVSLADGTFTGERGGSALRRVS